MHDDQFGSHGMLRALIVIGLLVAGGARAEFGWDGVERVVAVGDVHGAHQPLVELLVAAKVIDRNGRWQGGTSHLVSLGDLLDRGPDSRRTMDLLRRLGPEAEAAGGRVHVLLGNHEAMNLTGDYRDVSAAAYAAFASPDEAPDAEGLTGVAAYRQAHGPDGAYGSWLKSLPVVIRINRNVFAHGGLSGALSGFSLEEINTATRSELTARMAAPGMDAVGLWLGPDGPLWHRGNARCHALLEAAALAENLAALGADRVVIGHTPTASHEVDLRLDGKAIAIDTGMLAQVYGGEAWALEIMGEQLTAINARGGRVPLVEDPAQDVVLALTEGEIAEVDADLVATITLGTRTWRARFVPLGRKARDRAVAAHRLDQMLGLDVVPVTVARRVDGKQGVLMHEPLPVLSEDARREREVFRPNFCARGSAYELIAAFDALIGMVRDGQSLGYERGTWRLRALGNQKAFHGSPKLPTYARQPRLADALARRLEALDVAALEAALSPLLKRNRIEAILKRRDAILAWPRIGPVVPLDERTLEEGAGAG